MASWRSPVGRLRHIGWWEGVSFLLLVGIAMPLKYLAGKPMAVSVVGMAHGVLFVLYCLAVLPAWRARRWGVGLPLLCVGAALVPAGPFLLDRRLRREEEAWSASRSRNG